MNYKERKQALAELHVKLEGKRNVASERASEVYGTTPYFNRNWQNMKTEKAYGELKERIDKKIKEIEEKTEDVIDTIQTRIKQIQVAYDNELHAYQHLSGMIFEMDPLKKQEKKQETLQRIWVLNCDESVRTELIKRFHTNNF